MTDQEVQEFTLRMTQGNKTDLVVTTYDIIEKYLSDAEDAKKQEKKEELVWNIKKSREFLKELMDALDLSFKIGQELFWLYQFCDKQLGICELKRNVELFSSVREVFKGLREAFVEVAKRDESGPVVMGGSQVYAGLTYGKGILNESCEPTKGFKA